MTKNIVINIIYTLVAIGICLALGKLIYFIMGGLPASLYGMVIYCLLFQLGFLSPAKVELTNQWAINHMGVCFIPAAVGVINHYELFKHYGFAIIAIIVFTTFLLMTIIGILSEKYLTSTQNTKPTDTSC